MDYMQGSKRFPKMTMLRRMAELEDALLYWRDTFKKRTVQVIDSPVSVELLAERADTCDEMYHLINQASRTLAWWQ